MILLLFQVLTAPADTIRLGPGVHTGPLVLVRPTVIVGSPGAVLRGNGQGSVLVIQGVGSEVRDLRLERSGRDLDHNDAGVLVLADAVLLERLEMRDVLFGVYLKEVADVVLRELDIEGPAGLPEAQMGDGIHFFHSRRVVASGNRIRQVRDGMYFAYSDSVTVISNEVSRVRFGLHYMFSHQNRFERNRFTDNAAGAVLMNSNGLIVRDNVFAWNRGSRSYGLVLQTTSGARVENNSIVGNGIGIFLDNAIRARVTGNLVASNWLALQLFPNSEATVLTGNTVTGNFFDAAGGWVEGAYLLCDNGMGNYWSGARTTGFDLEGDGALDAPYAAGSPLGELAREREHLRLFLSSPAAQVINWAERTFPVFDIAQPVDSCPRARPAFQGPALFGPAIPPGPSDRVLFRGGLIGIALVTGAGLLGWRVPRRAR